MKKERVCVDLDGTLADYSKGWQGVRKIGDPLPGAQAFLDRLSKFAHIVIFTTRCCVAVNGDKENITAEEVRTIVQEWLDAHQLAWDEVYIGQGKPIASAYIDDRAISCTPQDDARAYQSALVRAQRFCNIHQDFPEET